jgi:cytochrome c oxidase cbb3-type subunit 3
MPTKSDKDQYQGRATTGHDWDGIQELNNPLPKWWLYVLYACIAWSIVIFVLYPSVPGLKSYWPGTLGYTQNQELAASIEQANLLQGPYLKRIDAEPLETIRADQDLAAFAIAGGRTLFGENCAACHGQGGAGRAGYPSLADDDWIWGGTLAQVQQTILFGVRSAHDKTRLSEMPKYGIDKVLTSAQIADVTEFVLALSKSTHDAKAAERGGPLYAENCVACHGAAGEGNRELGAPVLSDRLWLYGGDRGAIARQIANPRQGVMPAWSGRLSEPTIKMLSIYVHSLGGGEKSEK